MPQLTDFELNEIFRLKKVFYKLCSATGYLSKEQFLQIECIDRNPLKERIYSCIIDPYKQRKHFPDDDVELDLKMFLVGLSQFNNQGHRDQKLKIAFRLHDFDDDDFISKKDLELYITAITRSTELSTEEVAEVVNNVFLEFPQECQSSGIPFLEFQKVVGVTDFQAKLQIPI